MRRSYKLVDLECANCANKMEEGIKKLDSVNDCKINFMASKMTIDVNADDINPVLDEAQRICTEYEKDCVIVR